MGRAAFGLGYAWGVVALSSLVLLVVIWSAQGADLYPDENELEKDHELALRALLAGEIVTLREILDVAEARMEGELIEVELERLDGRWVYEVEYLLPDGRLVRSLWNAKTKALLQVESAIPGPK